jgi:hypothetical protein
MQKLAKKGKIDLSKVSNTAVALYHQLKEEDNPVIMLVYPKQKIDLILIIKESQITGSESHNLNIPEKIRASIRWQIFFKQSARFMQRFF